MVTVTWAGQNTGCLVTDGIHHVNADTTPEKGGAGGGFRPHDLLAAALGSCLAIQLRMVASRQRIPLTGVVVEIELDRSIPGQTVFHKQVRLEGDDISDAYRQRLHALCDTCPVQKSLSARLDFIVPDSTGV